MTAATAAFDKTAEASVQDYLDLLKPRVMSLVVFTALCGLVMAPGSLHPILAFSAILSIAMGAGAAGCLNMWWDQDIDALMSRTNKRPIPQGRVAPDSALAFGAILSSISVITMGVAIHWLAAGLLAFAILFYVIVYTMGLKRWTPHNIVIGGAAGAFPPLIGWAAATGTVPLEAWILFGIIFLWTPPHFWALSLYSCEDYARAKVPMLPVAAGIAATKRQIVFYIILLTLASLAPVWIGMASWIYGTFAGLLGAGFLGLGCRLVWPSLGNPKGDRAKLGGAKWESPQSQETPQSALQLFAYSIFYLFALFLIMTIDRVFL